MPANDDRVIEMAEASAFASYQWHDRGRAPIGYVVGMSVAFAGTYRDWKDGGDVAATIAAPLSGDANHDVLDWYAAEIGAHGLNMADPSDRLTAVFAIMIGLGMRESSGKHCEGRDMSAQNVTAQTAEAGLFQVSYNSHGAHPLLDTLIANFRGRDDLLSLFGRHVHCSDASWANWGEGPGFEFQALMKQCPQFAVQYTGILLRHMRRHWGPINRREAELVTSAVALLSSIRTEIDG